MSLSDHRKRKEIDQPLLHEYPRVATPYCYCCPHGCNNCAKQYAAEVGSVLDQYAGSTAAFVFEPISAQASVRLCRPTDISNQFSTRAERKAYSSSPTK
jgi:4-aminobutyrate aminotransferase-like enzyme